ncbi:MAG: histidine kinase N-terminal 7TM domain-containing protein, partial [Candidatus Margulisbacteria bacterium]|nr:histidine kinase N-terminal 7TM domain-containing protein [Candidatus Margulisiibacteriota bacterium]
MSELFNLANYGPNAHAERVLLSSVAILLLGIYVLLQNRKSTGNLAFSLICFCMFVWLSGFGFMSFVKKEAITLYWFKYAEAGVCFIPASVYFFAVSFVSLFKEKRHWVVFCYSVSTVFAVLLLSTDYFVSGVHKYYWGYYDLFGPLGHAFMVYFVLLMMASIYRFYYGLRRARTEHAR